MERRLESNSASLEPGNGDWLGGEAHVGPTDPTPPVIKLLQNLSADPVVRAWFGFASGLVIGAGVIYLLTRRRSA